MHPPIGLDISDLSAKMIQLDKRCGRHVVRSFGSAAIPPGSIDDGEIRDPDAVVRSVKTAMEKAGPKKPNTKRVTCSIPESKAFLRIISIPRMSEEEVKEAIVWELEENIPLSIDQVYYDYQILEKAFTSKERNSDKQDVLVVAVARNVVDTLVSVLERCNLEVIGMEIESVAQARCLLPDQSTKQYSLLILDIGDRRTSLLFSVDGAIAFTSSTHLSSQMLTDALAKHFNVSSEKAEKMKFEQGIGSPVAEDPFFRASEPVLENLYAQIRHSMDFVIDTLGYSDHLDMILLCGGGANTKGLPLYLSRRAGIPVAMGDPWINVSFSKKLPPMGKEVAIQYSTAIGLALQSMYFAYEDLS